MTPTLSLCGAPHDYSLGRIELPHSANWCARPHRRLKLSFRASCHGWSERRDPAISANKSRHHVTSLFLRLTKVQVIIHSRHVFVNKIWSPTELIPINDDARKWLETAATSELAKDKWLGPHLVIISLSRISNYTRKIYWAHIDTASAALMHIHNTPIV